mgnify:CR=1 FL=1
MTENEAKKELERHIQYLRETWKPHPDYNVIESLQMAIQALEQLKQYRAIGTVEDIQDIYSLCFTLQGIVNKYSEIGTTEEFKALKEKNEPKKVDEDYCCPICHTCGMDDDGIKGTYCTDCGQKLAWSE